MNEKLKLALRYRNKGWSIIPLKPKAKVPDIASWEKYQSEYATPEQIVEWFGEREDRNIGIITGSLSGLSVIDIDSEDMEFIKSLSLSGKVIARTKKGWHYYYKYCEGLGNRAKLNGEPVDVRSQGGYVVGPGSEGDDGFIYYWATSEPTDNTELEDFPQDILMRGKVIESDFNHKDFEKINEGVREGNRNESASKFIGSLIRGVDPIKFNHLWPAVKEWNNRNVPPLGEDELYRTFQSICGLEFRSVGEVKNGLVSDFKVVSGKDISVMKVSAPPFIVEGMIPQGAITSLTADSGKGKSIMATIIAKYICAGEPLFGEFKVKQTKVLVIDQEMAEFEVCDRHKKIFGDDKVANENISYLYQQFWEINDEAKFDWLVGVIRDSGFGLVVFDTLTNIHTLEENSADDMKKMNKLMLKLIAETGVTILYLHHHRKSMSGEKASMSSSRGSTEIIAKVASHIVLESSLETDYDGNIGQLMRLRQEKSRSYIRMPNISVHVRVDQEKGRTIWNYLGQFDDKQRAKDKAREFIERTLENDNEWCSVKQFERIGTDIGNKNLRIAVADLNDSGFLLSMTGKELMAKGDRQVRREDISSQSKYYKLKKETMDINS